MGMLSSRSSKGKDALHFFLPAHHDMDKHVGRRLKMLNSRWADSENLIQHQGRDWLQQMYAEFEDQQLLDIHEDIQHLKFIAGFASR